MTKETWQGAICFIGMCILAGAWMADGVKAIAIHAIGIGVFTIILLYVSMWFNDTFLSDS